MLGDLCGENTIPMTAKTLAKYAAIMGMQIINSAAYPLDLATRSLMIVMFMYVFMYMNKRVHSALGI